MPRDRSKRPCRCKCGYRCGGPGYCDLSPWVCLEQDDGKHYVEDCDHDFSVYRQQTFGLGTMDCSKCGLSKITHDNSVGP